MGKVMGKKGLFLVIVVLWLSPRAVPSVAGQPPVWCGDGICNTDNCPDGGIPGFDGCEENIWNCSYDCVNPCDNPQPHWVTDWGTHQLVGGYQYHGGWGPEGYCQYGTTNTVTQHDEQACVAARQPDRSVCFHQEVSWERRYFPEDLSCCSYYWCGGTGFSCP